MNDENALDYIGRLRRLCGFGEGWNWKIGEMDNIYYIVMYGWTTLSMSLVVTNLTKRQVQLIVSTEFGCRYEYACFVWLSYFNSNRGSGRTPL